MTDKEIQGVGSSRVERLKATYTLTARSYVRVIGQYVETRANPDLYAEPVEERSGAFSASALVAYRLNWQSVVFLGYGDSRTLSEDGGPPAGEPSALPESLLRPPEVTFPGAARA